jgi:hypothetical protein
MVPAKDRQRGSSHPGSIRRLAKPMPVRVGERGGGRPVSVDGRTVEAIRDTWLIEDRWWTGAPLRRRYWEVLAQGGAVRVIYRDASGRWFAHS